MITERIRICFKYTQRERLVNEAIVMKVEVAST